MNPPNHSMDDGSMTDLSPMTFGKFKGILMQDVPASYLHYLWAQGFDKIKREPAPTMPHQINSYRVAMYIRDNLEALKQEGPDMIW